MFNLKPASPAHPTGFDLKEKLLIALISLFVGALIGSSGQGVFAGVNDSQTNRIRGCVQEGASTTSLTLGGRSVPSNSILRLIDPDTVCLSGESQVDWMRYLNTVIVGPTRGLAGNSIQNGAALMAALAATTSGLIKVEPGIYDLNGQQLVMKLGVSIEGSGPNLTFIESNHGAAAAGSSAAVIVGNAVELRDLTVINSNSTQQVSIGVYYLQPTPGPLRLVNVNINVKNAPGSNFGLYRDGSSNNGGTLDPPHERLEISVSGGQNAVAVRLGGLGDVTLKDCNIKASSGSVTNTGILVEDAIETSGTFHTVDGCFIETDGDNGAKSTGISLNSYELNLRNSQIQAIISGAINQGIHNTSGTLNVTNTQLQTNGTSVFSEGLSSNTATTQIENSVLSAFNNQANSTLRIANSQIGGGTNTGGTVQCFNNYNTLMAAVSCP
jgi:hypothetical protein